MEPSGIGDWGGDWPPGPPPDVPLPPDVLPEVPHQLDTLPDGRASVTIGDVSGLAEGVHQQGDNPYGFQGTCGLCSCAGILREFGFPVTEADVVSHAIVNGECVVDSDPANSGGTTPDMQVRLLADYGIPAHVEQMDSLEEMADAIEQGRGAIIGANAGVLWNDASYYEYGQANHAVQVTGVARDPLSGAVQGFYINDTGTGQAGHFVDADTVSAAWLDAGGTAVVTDIVREVP
ncbi:hypothetical protein ABZS66_61385 [Dactylosporangium sp. NPDC005572]|uniref:hypothetical protein n=1 Tax=Dactylosporangium sp. NPDC005572 TaxID=3156889 RepID=UPI0033AB09DE